MTRTVGRRWAILRDISNMVISSESIEKLDV